MAKKTPQETKDAPADTNAEEQTPEIEIDSEARLDLANGVVQRNVYWAMGAGVLPFPIVDIVATTGVQLKMLRELSQTYGVPFKEGAAKKAVTSLLVGIGSVGIGSLIGASLVKSVPFIGQSLGVVSTPVIAGMLTHSVGRTFVMHFEAGGSLLDFDAKKMRKYFKEEYGRSGEVVKNMKGGASSSAAQASPA